MYMNKGILKLIISAYLPLLVSVPLMHSQDTALSNKVASYEMDVELDVNAKKLKGRTTLIWKNISDQEIDELYFHLYYNAFKNSRSTFFSERGVPEFLTRDIDETCAWAWSNISSFKDKNGHELLDSMQYVQTDDDNIHDETVLRIDLKEAVKPGSSHRFQFEWQTKIPKTMPRTGYNKDFYFFAQWFPKIGVLEPAGMRFAEETQWNCHQYHSNGEYYSDFGDYEVRMTVPSDYMVASSGDLTNKEMKGDMTTWQFNVSDVIDFSWSCSPHFVMEERKYKDVAIRFYSYPYKNHLADRYFNTIMYALEYMEEHFGPYPYPTLSIIDPPVYGMFTGGMEYPTLITSLSFCFFPEGIKTPETLVVHEFIHQYFMQMVASHEVEEAWMDEGITSYYESRILDSYMGENCSTIDFMGFKTGNKQFNRVEFFGMDNPRIASNAIKSWEYTDGGYGEIAYNKAALWLQTLEGLLGTEIMDTIMKVYFETWKFRHPCRNDFIEIVNRIVRSEMSDTFPDGMDWFFDQVLYGTAMCDYSIGSIQNELIETRRGIFKELDDCETDPEATVKYNSRVLINNLEDMYLPVQIVLYLENGEEKVYYWDGQAQSHTIEIELDHRVIAAEVDPDRLIDIDRNFVNNSLRIEKDSKSINDIATRVQVRIQSFFELIASLL